MTNSRVNLSTISEAFFALRVAAVVGRIFLLPLRCSPHESPHSLARQWLEKKEKRSLKAVSAYLGLLGTYCRLLLFTGGVSSLSLMSSEQWMQFVCFPSSALADGLRRRLLLLLLFLRLLSLMMMCPLPLPLPLHWLPSPLSSAFFPQFTARESSHVPLIYCLILNCFCGHLFVLFSPRSFLPLLSLSAQLLYLYARLKHAALLLILQASNVISI